MGSVVATQAAAKHGLLGDEQRAFLQAMFFLHGSPQGQGSFQVPGLANVGMKCPCDFIKRTFLEPWHQGSSTHRGRD
jgi:hypothetical protein